MLVHAVSIKDVIIESMEIEDRRKANMKEHVASGHEVEVSAVRREERRKAGGLSWR